MPLSESELNRIVEIVSGQAQSRMDAKALREMIDRVVDEVAAETSNGSDEVTGATCDTSGVSSSEPLISANGTKESSEEEVASVDGDSAPEPGGLYDRLEGTGGDRIILAAFGHNRPGVIAALTAVLAENLCNLEDISQKIMREFFTLIIIVDISGCPIDFSSLVEKVKMTESQLGMKVYMMREDTFQYMHRI